MDVILDPGLALYLPLYELDSATFASKDAYGHLSTVTGALWRFRGRYFDGSDDLINCGDNSILRPASNFTAIVWFTPTDVTVTGTIFTIPYDDGGAWDAPYVGWAIIIDNRTPSINTAWNIGGTYNDKQGDTVLVNDTVYCAAYTFDGTTHLGYLNGAQDSTTTDAGSITYSGTPACVLGVRSADALGQYFQGVVHEAWVYNRALTPSEIQQVYLSTKWRSR